MGTQNFWTNQINVEEKNHAQYLKKFMTSNVLSSFINWKALLQEPRPNTIYLLRVVLGLMSNFQRIFYEKNQIVLLLVKSTLQLNFYLL